MANKQRIDDDFDDDDDLDDDDDDQVSDTDDTPLIKKLRREKKQLERENKKLKKDSDELSKRRKDDLVKESGLEELSERKRNAVIRDAEESGTELTKENLREIAIDLGYIEEQEDETKAADTRIDNAGEGAKGGKSSSKITATDVNDWDYDKRQRFFNEHRDEWEAIKRGESVVVPSFQ